MKAITKFKLIETVIGSQEAKTILLELFSSKINFHERYAFSDLERFGKDLSGSKERVRELKEEKQKLEGLLNHAISEELKLSINCNIEIELLIK